MKKAITSQSLSPEHSDALFSVLKMRFEKHSKRHEGLSWSDVLQRLENAPGKLHSLLEMERSGGEPDLVGRDKKTGELIFVDCSVESPAGRRSVCYDREGLESRKEHKPETSAIDMAAAMGIEILNEEAYLGLQKLGDFDLKTSSWVQTPDEIRKRGGALYGERRYGRIFVGHNGAQSYYGVRGFRGSLRV